MSNTMIRLKAAALFGAVAVGFVAFGDFYDWKIDEAGYWEDETSWETISADFTDYRIGNHGPEISFKSLVEADDANAVLIYNGEHTFVSGSGAFGLTKVNAPLNVVGPWWYTYSTVLNIVSGTYQFASVNLDADATYGGTPGLVLAGGTLKTAYVAGSGGILTLNGGTLEFESTEYDRDGWEIIKVPLTIGSSGGTIDTGSGENNYRLAVTSSLSGSGLITKTGARPLSFTGDVSGFKGTITVAAGAGAVTVGETTIEGGKTVAFGNAYVWTGGAGVEDTSWSNGENWRTGTAPNDAEAEVLIPDGAVITLTEDATVGTVTINGTVTLTTNDYFLRSNKIIAGENGLLVLSNAKLAGISANSEISVALDIQTGTTNELYTANAGGQNGYPINVTSNISGDGKLIINAYASGGGDSNVNAGVTLAGDNRAFTGTMEYRLGQSGSKYQARQRDVLAASASSEDADWLFYMNSPGEPARNFGLLFSTENGEYKFGSARINLPQSAYTVANGVSFVIGKKNTDSFIKGTWGKSVSVEWIASTATLTNNAANTGSISLTGGGNLALSASGIPGAINFSEEGGCLVLSDDDDLNASVLAAVSTVAEGASIGFVYDGEAVKTLDLSGKKTLLAGKNIVKRGTGTVYLTGLAGVTLGDVTVEEGTLALQHGAKVGTVTVEDGAEFYVDLTGAVDGEEVFEYADYVGEGKAEYRNLAEGAAVTIDDEGETTVWTLSRAAKRYTWTGAVSTDYSYSGNWEPAGIPTTDDTVVFTSDTMLKPGAVFGTVELQNGAKISFDFTLGKVGASTTLIKLTKPGSVTASDFVSPGANYDSNFSGGVFATTRKAATYTWTGSVDNSWATSGNWTVGAAEVREVREVPEPEDSVVFPASDAEDFENWEVTLDSLKPVKAIVVDGNTVFSGNRIQVKDGDNVSAVSGKGKIILGDNAGFYPGDQLGLYLTIENNIEVAASSGNPAKIQGRTDRQTSTVAFITLKGNLTGSGSLLMGGTRVRTNFYGDNTEFAGILTIPDDKKQAGDGRSEVWFEDSDASSAKAIWNIYSYELKGNSRNIIGQNKKTYSFGELSGYIRNNNASNWDWTKFEIGAANTDFTLEFHGVAHGDREDKIRKVGTGTMTLHESTDYISEYEIAGGTLYITSMNAAPSRSVSFEGGTLRTRSYDYEAKEQQQTGVDEDGNPIYEEQTVTRTWKADFSGLIVNSTGPISFDDDGVDYVWAKAIADSNTGGFAKYGAGTLTLAEKPLYEGVTSVWGGSLIVPNGTELIVNPLSTGTIATSNDGDPIKSYCYAPGTVLNGTETADDNLDKQLDVDNVEKVDFSNPSPAMLADLCKDGIFVLAKTSDSTSRPAVVYEKKKENPIELVMLGEDYEWPAGVEKPKWWNESTKWTVRVLTVKENGKKYTALAVARGEFPFVISVQ